MADAESYLHDTLDYVQQTLGNEEWLTAYQWTTTDDGSNTELHWCQTISGRERDRALANPEQLHEPEFGRPGFIVYPDDRPAAYYQFGDDTGDEPLVIRRDFYDLKQETLDIAQEFRLFHNLYSQDNRTFVKFDDAGNEEKIVRPDESGRILIRRYELRQYLAAKSALLVAHFDYERSFPGKLADHGMTERNETLQEGDLTAIIVVRQSRLDSDRILVSVYGNKIVSGLPLEECGIYPYDKDSEVGPDFIVDIGPDDKPVLAHPGAANFLTPLFFSREVLVKYQNNPDRYHIHDGFMQCAGLWSLRFDNDLPDCVVAFLGDLGQLSVSEQIYWKSFNIRPNGPISATAIQRGVYGQFANPTSVDLVFKQEYGQFLADWHEKFGWSLLQPLIPGDAHYFGGLTIPLTDSQREFDEQIQALAKILIDSLNDVELRNHTTSPMDKCTQSISKLEYFLQEKNVPNYEPAITFLRNLQDVRSTGSAHRKGNNYERALAEFGGGSTTSLQRVFRTVLTQAIDFLHFMQTSFLVRGEHPSAQRDQCSSFVPMICPPCLATSWPRSLDECIGRERCKRFPSRAAMSSIWSGSCSSHGAGTGVSPPTGQESWHFLAPRRLMTSWKPLLQKPER